MKGNAQGKFVAKGRIFYPLVTEEECHFPISVFLLL